MKGRETSKDRIILAQISGKPPSLLFDGTPAKFAEQFPSPASLREFMLEKTDPNGSPVHNVINDSLTYLISLHEQAASREVKPHSCILVFSDMEDNAPDTEGTRKQMGQLFKQYLKTTGGHCAVGFYWVDLAYVPGVTRMLHDTGLKPSQFIVENGINVSPRLPVFD
jgi:hypothetical protein